MKVQAETKTERINIRIAPSKRAKLETLARQDGRTLSAFIERSLDSLLRTTKAKK